MKRLTFLVFLLVTSVQLMAQKSKQQMDLGEFTVRYEREYGRFHGKYQSYYPNGQKRAEGNYEYNSRIGKWTIWDSNGVLICSRNYSGPFSYDRLFPKIPKEDPTVQLITGDQPEFERNEKGIYPYSKIEERTVVWSKRIWRDLDPELNKGSFDQKVLFETLLALYSRDSISFYTDKWTKIPYDTIFKNRELITFRILEDAFFDSERYLMETRMLALIPIVLDPKTSDSVELGRFYFPHVRNVINELYISGKDHDIRVKSLDDLFLFRDFASKIIKVSNVHDIAIRDYKNGVDPGHEAEKEELLLIETDHDHWILFSGGGR